MPIPRFTLPYADQATPGLLGGRAYTNRTRRALGRAVRELNRQVTDDPRPQDWAHIPYVVGRLSQAPEMEQTSQMTARFTAREKIAACAAVEESGFDWRGVARTLGCRVTHLRRWYARMKVLRARYF